MILNVYIDKNAQKWSKWGKMKQNEVKWAKIREEKPLWINTLPKNVNLLQDYWVTARAKQTFLASDVKQIGPILMSCHPSMVTWMRGNAVRNWITSYSHIKKTLIDQIKMTLTHFNSGQVHWTIRFYINRIHCFRTLAPCREWGLKVNVRSKESAQCWRRMLETVYDDFEMLMTGSLHLISHQHKEKNTNTMILLS